MNNTDKKKNSIKFNKNNNSIKLKNFDKNNIKKNKTVDNNKKILINQILKVLKVRLYLEDINAEEEYLIKKVSENLDCIDLRYFQVSSLGVFVDDIIDIIKNEKGTKNIMSLNRKEYKETLIDKKYNEGDLKSIRQINNKNDKNKKDGMKIGIYKNECNPEIKEYPFYLDSNSKHKMSELTDCDFDFMKENVINQICNEK